MKRAFTVLFLIPNLFCSFLFMELDKQYSIQAQSNIFYPRIQSVISPSPQATAITKYGDYPVNYNTGLVDMRIPIYNVKSGSLNMPIDISFHASGRMANENNGILGMRWVLNAGGVVTRTVHGYPDEWEKLTPYTVNPNQIPEYDQLRRSCPDNFIPKQNDGPIYQTDSEFDIFSYVLPSGKSGKFVLKNDNGVKKVVQIPYEALKIELAQDSTYYGYYGAIKITDIDGTVYNYGDGTVNSGSGYCEFNDEDDIPGKFGSTPTGWYLKSIVAADRKDSIQFDYQIIYSSKVNGSESVRTLDRMRDYNNVYPDAYDLYGINLYEYLFELPTDYNYGSSKTMTVPVLKSIKFNEGELNFNYRTTDSPYKVDNKYLEYISLTGVINRKFKFNQELDPNENFIRYLVGFDVISVFNAVEKVEEKYAFDYYRPSTINPTLSLAFSSEKKDWWGYYNYSTNHLLPYKSINYIRNNHGSFEVVNRNVGNSVTRDPDIESMKLGMLKSISYPTGGKIEFEYELNYYKEVPNPSVIKIGSGLRIKKVIKKPIIGKEMVKTYRYGENEDKAGYINTALRPETNNSIQESGMMHYWDSFVGENAIVTENQAGYRIRTFSADPLINSDDFGGNIVWYNLVTEYSETEQQGGYNGENYNEGKNGKTIYEYSQKLFDTKQFEITDREYYIDSPKVFADPYNLWQGGKLLSKTLYKKNDGLFIPTLKESYNYYNSNFEEVWDMPTYRHVNFSYNMIYNKNFSHVNSSNIGEYMYNKEKNYHNNICSVYGYGFRKYVSGSEKIASKTIEHFDGDGIALTTEYFYDPQYDQLRKEEITKSDGKKISFQYSYPFDKTILPLNDMTNVYNKMLNMNMISTPLLKLQYEINRSTNVFTQSKRTDFFEPFANVIRPKTEYYKKGNEVEEAIIDYHSYDEKGNILEVSQVGGTHVAYIWGYDKKYPVAKIENMTYVSIPQSLITAIELASSSTGSEASLFTALNNLRNDNALSGAMVTTYTYKPLIGMTSMTDPKGEVVYYEYDSYSRLQQVKDKENNVLSKNEYHYKNQ
jgi:hypothetical protein